MLSKGPSTKIILTLFLISSCSAFENKSSKQSTDNFDIQKPNCLKNNEDCSPDSVDPDSPTQGADVKSPGLCAEKSILYYLPNGETVCEKLPKYQAVCKKACPHDFPPTTCQDAGGMMLMGCCTVKGCSVNIYD